MSEFVLQAEVRELTGKRAKHSRLAGMVPGVFYARKEKSLNIQVLKPGLDPLVFTSETHVIDLRLKDGSSRKCILRDVQFDPVTDRPVHFDLQGLKEDEKLSIEVPVVLTGGIPLGVRDGGMVQHILHRLKITCLPKDIPEKVELDITDLGINHSIHVRDLKIPNVTLLDHADNAVVSVLPPTVVKEAEVVAVAEEGVKEPEVVGKGKKPEEGESAEPAKGDAKAVSKDAKPASKDAKPAAKDAKPAAKEAKPAPKEEKKK